MNQSLKRPLIHYIEFLRNNGFIYADDASLGGADALNLIVNNQPAEKTQVRGNTASTKTKNAGKGPAIAAGENQLQQPPGKAKGFDLPTSAEPAIPVIPPSKTLLAPLPCEERIDLLAAGAARAEACRACPLGFQRIQAVYGVGDPMARIVFVGEGPGAEEDQQGKPFVGRSGQLLDKMILAIGFRREEVYICNTVKCRPPGNRDPLPAEKDACEHFLVEQLQILRAQIVVALGAHAAQYLCRSEASIGQLRGRWHDYHGVALLATYHPAFLLRSPGMKPRAWDDFQMIHKKYGELCPDDARKLWAKE